MTLKFGNNLNLKIKQVDEMAGCIEIFDDTTKEVLELPVQHRGTVSNHIIAYYAQMVSLVGSFQELSEVIKSNENHT